MSHEHEREAKFYVSTLYAVKARLKEAAARQLRPQVHELNLRFDTPSGDLTSTYQVLRLRQDDQVRLTYKGPGDVEQGVSVRKEIEFIANNFDAARLFLEALGYRVQFIYEKNRSKYEMEEVEIVLDETPLGNFVEIEGPDGNSIQSAADLLGLKWEARSNKSYLALFDLVKVALGLEFRDMTFENFKDLNIPPAVMGLKVANQSE